MTDATIFAISLGITVLGLVISWGVYRRRGAAPGLRGAAWSLVPLAAAMTGVTEFVTDLAFSPAKWLGVGVAGLAVVLYLTSGMMLTRRAGRAPARGETGTAGEPKAAGKRAPKAGKAVEQGGAQSDPEMAEIEAILRDRGIK
jgi:hypothetical protein